MSVKRKGAQKTDLIAGAIVVVMAILLMVAVMVSLRQCTASVPTLPPETTAPPPVPTLAPNPHAPGDFVYDANGYITYLVGESWLGVDVSEHQGSIQWSKVATSDVRFAMVRLAYRGWGQEGVIRADARGLENLKGAMAADLAVGVYFFSQAISVEEAVEEARFVLALLDGCPLDLPVVFDWETVSSEDARTANVNAATLNACAQAFCRENEAAGYEAAVYFNLDFAKRMYDLLALQTQGYDFWLAMYADALTYGNRVQMWQYTDRGRVPGIAGNVDLNLYFPQG